MAARPACRRVAGALLLALALLAAPPACLQNDGSRNPLANFGKVSEEDERDTGAQADAQIREVVPLVDDPLVLGFLNDLGQDIVRRIEPQPFIYRFRLVDENSLNAFAIPGGYIYFHTATLLRAGSLAELAGVMAHEIAHVKGRHYARMVEAAAIPTMLSRLAAIGVAVAAETPAPIIVGEGLNVALQLHYTRRFEAEADELATAFLARAGYPPAGMADFFRRIVAEEKRAGPRFEPPPYLYTHPDVEERIDSALARAEGVTVIGHPSEEMERDFRRAQLRLALMLERGVTTLRADPPDRNVAEPYLARARERLAADDDRGALAILVEGERAEPRDPRLPFERGRIHRERGRTQEAIRAWRQAVLLDPSVGLVFFEIGEAYKELGDRINATFYFEQAERRFEPGGSFQRRAAREVERLTFPVIQRAGISSGPAGGRDDGVLIERHLQELERGRGSAVWWAEVAGRHRDRREEIVVVFTDPAGHTAHEETARVEDGLLVAARLPLADASVGIWRVEARLDDSVIDRRTFHVVPPR